MPIASSLLNKPRLVEKLESFMIMFKKMTEKLEQKLEELI